MKRAAEDLDAELDAYLKQSDDAFLPLEGEPYFIQPLAESAEKDGVVEKHDILPALDEPIGGLRAWAEEIRDPILTLNWRKAPEIDEQRGSKDGELLDEVSSKRTRRLHGWE